MKLISDPKKIPSKAQVVKFAPYKIWSNSEFIYTSLDGNNVDDIFFYL